MIPRFLTWDPQLWNSGVAGCMVGGGEAGDLGESHVISSGPWASLFLWESCQMQISSGKM